MSDNIVPFGARKDDDGPTVEGKARCMLCRHEWAACAPAGAVWLECPECHAHKGHFIYATEPEDGRVIWTCICGGEVFYVLPDARIICCNCGLTTSDWWNT